MFHYSFKYGNILFHAMKQFVSPVETICFYYYYTYETMSLKYKHYTFPKQLTISRLLRKCRNV